MARSSYKTPVRDSEIFFFYRGSEVSKNVVIDASTLTANTSLDGTSRYLLAAGTLLQKQSNGRYAKHDGTRAIEGVLALDFEATAAEANSQSPVGLFFGDCYFDASKIVDYSTYGSNAISTLKTQNCFFLIP